MVNFIHKGKSAARRIRKSRYRKRITRVNEILFLFALYIAFFSYLTNPFARFSAVKDPFRIGMYPDGQLQITPVEKLYLADNVILNVLGELKAISHLIGNKMSGGGKASKSTTVDTIIDDIHALRFNPLEPYLISGDHFSVLYPRSLGIFYNTILDPRTERSDLDWLNRQKIYLETTLYTLLAYQHSTRLSTTITPTGPNSVTLNNYFDPPSDTLYSILYALRSLQTSEDLFQYYPFPIHQPMRPLQTRRAAQEALAVYKDELQNHFYAYIQEVVDPKTQLVRTDKSFSGTKDSVIRFGSFYDNVILWKTIQLAQQLEIIPQNTELLQTLKNKIIKTYWLPNEGYFLEDLTDKSIQNKHYSSDWLIVLMTGFLSPANKDEREYFVRNVEYIQKEKLDVPFGLKYQPSSQQNALHLPLRLFAPTYGTQAIWSHWGMEYIKLLTFLYQQTCTNMYLDTAKQQVDAYTQNILETKGYPELYNSNGKIFNNPFYKGVYQTGWVVNYELAAKMVTSTYADKSRICPISSEDQYKIKQNIPPSSETIPQR